MSNLRGIDLSKGPITPHQLRQAFLAAASEDTAFDKDFYEKNKDVSVLTGHCYVCAAYAKEIFGGDLIKGFVNGESHYWNRWPNGAEMDFTSDQFGGDGIRPVTTGEVDTRPFETFERYEIFKARVDKLLGIQEVLDQVNEGIRRFGPDDGRYHQQKCLNPMCGWVLPGRTEKCLNPQCGWVNPYYNRS